MTARKQTTIAPEADDAPKPAKAVRHTISIDADTHRMLMQLRDETDVTVTGLARRAVGMLWSSDFRKLAAYDRGE